jgi:hypothetical protein
VIFAESLTKRKGRKVFFDEIVDFPKRKRNFGGLVRKERSGRPPRGKKRIRNVLAIFAHFCTAPMSNIQQNFDNLFAKFPD